MLSDPYTIADKEEYVASSEAVRTGLYESMATGPGYLRARGYHSTTTHSLQIDLVNTEAAMIQTVFSRHRKDGSTIEYGRAGYAAQKRSGAWKFVALALTVVKSTTRSTAEYAVVTSGNCNDDPAVVEGTRMSDALWAPTARGELREWFVNRYQKARDANNPSWVIDYYAPWLQLLLLGPGPADMVAVSPASHTDVDEVIRQFWVSANDYWANDPGGGYSNTTLEMLRIDMVAPNVGIIQTNLTRKRADGSVLDTGRFGYLVYKGQSAGSVWRLTAVAGEIEPLGAAPPGIAWTTSTATMGTWPNGDRKTWSATTARATAPGGKKSNAGALAGVYVTVALLAVVLAGAVYYLRPCAAGQPREPQRFNNPLAVVGANAETYDDAEANAAGPVGPSYEDGEDTDEDATDEGPTMATDLRSARPAGSSDI